MITDLHSLLVLGIVLALGALVAGIATFYIVGRMFYNMYRISEKRYLLEVRHRADDNTERYEQILEQINKCVEGMHNLEESMAQAGFLERRTETDSRRTSKEDKG